jgi:subtilisin family serine protease
MVAFAVTNTSTLKTPENAKSVLAVGATNQAPSQESIGSGGRGPTSDGRRKPEVFSPGINIQSARNGTTNQWRSMSGTSMACPSVTGAAALVRQYLEEGYLPNGVQSASNYDPTGAMVRALLMNASVNMSGPAGYPSNEEGWGRLLLDNSLWFAGESRRTVGMDLPNAYGRSPGGVLEFQVQVLNSNTPFRATMSFTDYPAQVFAGQAPVNNVDLEVIAPDGTLYRGNVITNGQSSSGGAADAKNSTEMVMLSQPAIGIYRVRAVVTAVNQGNRQGMAVVVNGNLVPVIQRRRS